MPASCIEARAPKKTDYVLTAPRAPSGSIDLRRFTTSLRDGAELSIGFGRGRFLLERAALFPERLIIGVEIKAKLSVLVAQKAKSLGLGNVLVWCENIHSILERLKPESVLDRVYLNFPDPWWKKRHQKRLVLNAQLIGQIAHTLKPQGEFFVQTDVPLRAEEYFSRLSLERSFGGEVKWLDHNPYQALSNREARAVRDGLPIYRILATRS